MTGGSEMVYLVLCWAYSIKMGEYRQDFRINLWKALLYLKDKVHSRINGDTKLIQRTTKIKMLFVETKE